MPEGVAHRSTIIYNHGFSESVELYDKFLPFFALRGHRVIVYDQRGSGQTSPQHLYALTNEKYVLGDLDRLIETVVREAKTADAAPVPLFLWGHSMGGGIVLNYGVVGTYRELFAGYLAFAPLVDVAPETAPAPLVRYALLPLLAWVAPNLRRLPGAAGSVRLTHDDSWRRVFEEDHAERAVCSAAQMHDMLARGLRLLRAPFVARFVPRTPVAVFHSVADEINDYKATHTFFELLTADDGVLRVVHKDGRDVEAVGSDGRVFYSYEDFDHCMAHETLDRQYMLVEDVGEFLDSVLRDQSKKPLGKTPLHLGA